MGAGHPGPTNLIQMKKVYVLQKKTGTIMSIFVSSLKEIDKRTYQVLSIIKI